MKVVAIGDTHGRSTWKQVVEQEKDADKIVFIGDYFDSFSVPFSVQLANFVDIVRFKNENPEKVVLLIGNHDFHYLPYALEKYSGYQDRFVFDINLQLEDAVKQGVVQMAYEHDNFLFTHAGVTNTWVQKWVDGDFERMEDFIKYLFEKKPEAFRFAPGERNDNSGDDITQSPIWVRPRSLLEDKVDGYIQIVGHTTMPSVIADLDRGICLIDSLGKSGQYLTIIDGVIEVKKVL